MLIIQNIIAYAVEKKCTVCYVAEYIVFIALRGANNLHLCIKRLHMLTIYAQQGLHNRKHSMICRTYFEWIQA